MSGTQSTQRCSILLLGLADVWALSLSCSAFAVTPVNTSPQRLSRDAAPIASGVKTTQPGQDATQEMADSLSDPLYTKCGQNCYHEKARENMSLQILYMQRKLNQLDDYRDSLNRSNEDQVSAQILELLGDYCKGHEDLDSLLECADRYSKTHTLWLTQARGVLAQSEAAIQKLKCAEQGADGSCQVPIMEDGALRDNPDKKTQTPYLLKSGDFLRFYEERKKKNPLSKQNPMGDFILLKPQPIDFVKFKEVNDPTSVNGKSRVPILIGGQPDYDRDAYNKALELWKKQKMDLQALADERVRSGEKLHLQLKDEFKSEIGQQIKGIHRRLYDEARAQYIQEFDGFAKEVVWANQNKSGDKNSKTIGSKGQVLQDSNKGDLNPVPKPVFDPSKVTGDEDIADLPVLSPPVQGSGRDRVERHLMIEADHFRFKPPQLPASGSGSQTPLPGVNDTDPGYEYIEY